MFLLPADVKDDLLAIADYLNEKVNRIMINKGVKFSDQEKEKIIDGYKRIIFIMDPAGEIIKSYAERIKENKKFLKKYKNVLLSRKKAIELSGYSDSEFDKKVRKNPDIIMRDANGKPFFKIDDVVKIRKFHFETSPSILCVNTFYHFDEKRDGYITFDEGDYYKVVEENEGYSYIYTEKWEAIVKVEREKIDEHFMNYPI